MTAYRERLRVAASRSRADALAVAALAVLVLVAGGPLVTDGWFATHEGAAPLERVIAFAHEIRSGALYPRWLSLADSGKGSAFPHFYAPGFYLAAAHLFAAGVPLFLSLKLVLVAILLAGAIGTYCWTRRRFGPAGAFVSATLYLFAPYHFVDLYVRGALAELAALGLLPWLFFGIDLAATRRGRAGPAVVALSTAAIVVSHNLSAFMIAPFAAAYLAWAAWGGGAGWRALARGATGAAAGAGLSAFYWIPALVDQRYLRGLRAATTSGMYSFEKHFVLPRQLVDTTWGFGASLPGSADEMSFQVGLAILAFSAAGAAAAVARRARRPFVVCTVLLGLVALALTLEPAAPLYRAIPMMPMVQFPWRYLGPAVLFLSAAGGAALSWLEGTGARLPTAARLAVAAGCVAACVFGSSAQRVTVPAPEMAIVEAPETLASIEEHHLLGVLCGENEYLPAWVSDRASAHRYFGPPRPFVPGTARTGGVVLAGAAMVFEATASEPVAAGIPWYYFPGWTARVDGEPAAIGPGAEGFLSLPVPPGTHRVEVAFDTTPSGRIATGLSAITALLAGLALVVRPQTRSGAGADAEESSSDAPVEDAAGPNVLDGPIRP